MPVWEAHPRCRRSGDGRCGARSGRAAPGHGRHRVAVSVAALHHSGARQHRRRRAGLLRRLPRARPRGQLLLGGALSTRAPTRQRGATQARRQRERTRRGAGAALARALAARAPAGGSHTSGSPRGASSAAARGGGASCGERARSARRRIRTCSAAGARAGVARTRSSSAPPPQARPRQRERATAPQRASEGRRQRRQTAPRRRVGARGRGDACRAPWHVRPRDAAHLRLLPLRLLGPHPQRSALCFQRSHGVSLLSHGGAQPQPLLLGSGLRQAAHVPAWHHALRQRRRTKASCTHRRAAATWRSAARTWRLLRRRLHSTPSTWRTRLPARARAPPPAARVRRLATSRRSQARSSLERRLYENAAELGAAPQRGSGKRLSA